jgi:hypothetical protein
MANEREMDQNPDLLDDEDREESPRERVGGESKEDIRGIADDRDDDFEDADDMEDEDEEDVDDDGV